MGKEKTVSELLITELLSVGSGISLAIFTTNVSYAVAMTQRQVLSYIFILYLVCFPGPNLFVLLLTVHYYCKFLKLNKPNKCCWYFYVLCPWSQINYDSILQILSLVRMQMKLMKLKIIKFWWQITICFSHPKGIFCTAWIITLYGLKKKLIGSYWKVTFHKLTSLHEFLWFWCSRAKDWDHNHNRLWIMQFLC